MQTLTPTVADSSDDGFIAHVTLAQGKRIESFVAKYITGWRYAELVDEATNVFRTGVWQAMQSYCEGSQVPREDWCARRGYGAVADYLRTQLGRRQRLTHMKVESTMLSSVEHSAMEAGSFGFLNHMMRDAYSLPTDDAAIAQIEFEQFLATLKPFDRRLAELICTGEYEGTLLACECHDGHSFQADVTRVSGKPRWTVEQALARLRKLMRGTRDRTS